MTRSFNQAALWHLADGLVACTKNGARERGGPRAIRKMSLSEIFPLAELAFSYSGSVKLTCGATIHVGSR
ncbi:MAG: hypothetical protein KKC48_16225, partial [Proteobacteria bacterium]|nr:hypothetical protein [Pseudomonadota bacterium]